MKQAIFWGCVRVMICAFLATTLSLGAADITWVNASGGDWNTAANWNPPQVPGSSDNAILALGVTVTVDAPATVGNVAFSSGTLGGSGNLTVSGTMNWTGGTMNGSGATTIGSGGSLVISGTGIKFFGQRTINNGGTASWSGADIWSGGGATITNQAGGVFDVQGDASFLANQGGPVTINNAGTFKKSGGTGTTSITAAFNNSGSVIVQTGTLSLGNGGDSHGSFNAQPGGVLNFAGGAMTLESNSGVTGAGTIGFSGGTVDVNGGYTVSGSTVINGGTANFNGSATTVGGSLSSGTLGGSGNLTVSGTMNWTGGTMNGSGATTIGSGGSLVISGTGIKFFGQRTINNGGTASWSGADIWSGGGATITNQAGGVFDVQGDASFLANQGGPVTINNAGTFKKSGGTGTTSITAAFNNSGSVIVQTGTINAGGPNFSNSANSILGGSGTLDISHTSFASDGAYSPGNPLGALTIVGNLPPTTNGSVNIEIGGTTAGVNYDQLIVTGNATLNGALNITLVNGFQPGSGETFEIIKYGSHTGSFSNISGLNLGGGFYLKPSFGSTNLILTTIDNRPRPQFLPPQRFPNGDIHFQLTGIAGQTFVIQATTNFSDWVSVLTNVNSGAVYDLIITDSTVIPYRFYRTYQP